MNALICTGDIDYGGFNNALVTLSKNQTVVNYNISIINDEISESNETFNGSLSIFSANNRVLINNGADTAIVTILDNDSMLLCVMIVNLYFYYIFSQKYILVLTGKCIMLLKFRIISLIT